MKPLIMSILVLILLPGRAVPDNGTISEATETCLGCHALSTPGIVADWKNSRHSKVTPKEALAKPPLERRVSAEKIDEALGKNVVGCAECHTLNSGKHPDSFEHGGTNVHVVVSPQDCAVCHPTEKQQYDQNLMSRAHGNLVKNPVYLNLADSGSVFTAWRNQTRLVIVAGQQTSAMLPTDPFLGARYAAEFPRPYVKWSVEPARGEDVPHAIAQAIYTSLQRPCGPVFVSVPEDDWVVLTDRVGRPARSTCSSRRTRARSTGWRTP